MRRGVFWLVLVVGIFLAEVGLSQTMELGDIVYIGERFPITLHVADTLVVLNLNNPAKVYEFTVDQPGTTIELCFVRPCDHPCECVPTECIILANPGDEILFVLKANPQKEEVRRAVVRSPAADPTVQVALVERAGKCYLQFKVVDKSADLTCNLDEISVEFFIHDPQKPAKLVLKETGPITGEFVGEYQVEITYAQGKFTVSYHYGPAGKQESAKAEFFLPELPKVTVKVGETQLVRDLVDKIAAPLLDEIPSEFRLDGYCSFVLEFIRGIVQSHFAQPAEAFVEVQEGKLCVIVKEGCRYHAGIKEVKVLPPVQLVIKDEKGNVIRGGRLSAGTTYKIEAMNGLSDGCILIIELGCTGDKGESCPTVQSKKGASLEWSPTQADVGKTFAIVYVDKHLCNPPALIVTVD